MRKFAMTLILGLGMATASFAGGVETAEAKAEAPKDAWCMYLVTSCAGPVTVCTNGALLTMIEAMKIEDDLCGTVD